MGSFGKTQVLESSGKKLTCKEILNHKQQMKKYLD